MKNWAAQCKGKCYGVAQTLAKYWNRYHIQGHKIHKKLFEDLIEFSFKKISDVHREIDSVTH